MKILYVCVWVFFPHQRDSCGAVSMREPPVWPAQRGHHDARENMIGLLAGDTYLRLLEAAKAGAPDIHVHAFSPLEAGSFVSFIPEETKHQPSP